MDHLIRLLTLDRLIAAGSALADSEVEILTYADTAALVAQTRHALDQAIAAGFHKDMFAVVRSRGREGSALGAFDPLGGHRLRRFTGGYDAGAFGGGDPPPRPLSQGRGEVIHVEMRKVFVGATRATMKLFLVMSEVAAGVLLDRLGPR